MTAGRTTQASRRDRAAAVPSALGPDHGPWTASCQEGRQRHYSETSCNLQKHKREHNCSCYDGNSTLHSTRTFQHTLTSMISWSHHDRPGGRQNRHYHSHLLMRKLSLAHQGVSRSAGRTMQGMIVPLLENLPTADLRVLSTP